MSRLLDQWSVISWVSGNILQDNPDFPVHYYCFLNVFENNDIWNKDVTFVVTCFSMVDIFHLCLFNMFNPLQIPILIKFLCCLGYQANSIFFLQ